MSESTETPTRSHLQPVREEAPASSPDRPAPARQAGGHLTGLLALLLAVAVFALLGIYSQNRQLQTENEALQATLVATQAELAASQDQMEQARDALGGLRDVLVRIETLLAPPSAAGTAAEPPAPAADLEVAPAD